MSSDNFKEIVWDKGRQLYRDMPWRANTDPYYVLVSELMLQQTQVERVIPKFNDFVKRFPDLHTLASSPLSEVLSLWSGLGYNRRAKFLQDAAKKVVTDYAGNIPNTLEQLVSLPGIGPNTAGAILAYGFNQPVVFIETNIRTVYFYHFFEEHESVSDKLLYKTVEETLDHEHPRQWYQALMDYGTYLKKQGAGRIDKSAHYKKQSPLKGSMREVRGQIVRTLTSASLSKSDLKRVLVADERFENALQSLVKDGLIRMTDGKLHLTK